MTGMLSTRAAAAAAFLLGLAAILTAWGFQIFGGFVPCKLCLEQRYPYYVGLPLLLAALVLALRGEPSRAARVLLGLGGLVFLVGAGLGVFHAGVEWGFWPGPSDCAGAFVPSTSAADLLSQVSATRVVSCTEASWRFLGLSFAGWNVLASLGVAALALAGAVSARVSR